MRRLLWISAVLLALPASAWAYPPTVMGAAPMSTDTAHNVHFGWPSVGYEWWNKGRPDWALGAEIVYGDWAAEYSNAEIGLGLNVPLRWHLSTYKRADFAFRFAPGILIADAGRDSFAFGMRGEFGVPVSVGIVPQVNLITGLVVPFSVFIVENRDDYAVLPILPRIGAEFLPDGFIAVWFAVEMGPTIRIGGASGDRVDFGVRGWLGCTFWR
jgi:hypothetical protein